MAETTLTFLSTGNPTGLKFSVEHGDRRCLFDFGVEYAPGRALFSQGLAPRPGRELADLVAVGSAPALPGVYAGDRWDGRSAVFISHLHLDHTSLVRFLHPEVPLHYPAAMEPVRSGAAAAGYLPWREPPGRPVPDGDTVRWGEIEVRFVAVDHDVPGATGFVVRTPDLSLAFTGDQRWHGLHPELTAGFAEAAHGVDVLIQEGVQLGFEPGRRTSEQDVVDGFRAVLASHPGLVVVNLLALNRERVAAFAAATAAGGRRLVLEPEAAVIAGHADVLTADALAAAREAPGRFAVQLSYESLPDLIDLAPPAGSVYVHSNGPPLGQWDPAYGVMESWARTFGLEFVSLGSSGHSYPEDIVRTVAAVRPGVVLPVHSAAPDRLEVPGVPRLVPQVGRPYRASELRSAAAPA